MATEVIVPQFGSSPDIVTILSWLKNEGEKVNRGDVLCSVETDKSAIEIESFVEGVLLKQLAEAGSEVETGAVIAYVGQAGEDVSELPEQATPNVFASVETSDAASVEVTKLKATPRVRKLARELDVDLSTIIATGKDNRITEDDVKKAAEGLNKATASGARDSSLSRNQLAVARRIRKSHQEIIAINMISKIDMSSAINRRESLYRECGQKITFDTLFIYAVSRALTDFPRFCCYYDSEKLLDRSEVNVGVAISTEMDLYIPVVKNAEGKSFTEINNEVKAFAEKAHEGTLSAEEMTGAVFTVSNLGMYPVNCFNMIIPPQQSGALSIGSIEEVPVFREKALTAEPVVTVMLSVDHRFINGRVAAEFIAEFKRIMEQL